jgi:acyl dehydratase
MRPGERVHRLVAHNTASDSGNRIHADDVARTLGFRGGLVPGVDVWAYLAHLPAERWGHAWLEHGAMRAELRKPVYDGDEVEARAAVTADDTLALSLADSAGEVCARGEATLPPVQPAVDVDAIPRQPLPGTPPDATPESLAPGTVLGTLEIGYRGDRAGAYLDDVREALPLFRIDRPAHPAWLLRVVNWAFAANVRLGPWIHTASVATHLGIGRDGDRLSVRSRVTREYERGGHRWVELDALVVANDLRPLLRVAHTAIYRPRGGAPRPH